MPNSGDSGSEPSFFEGLKGAAHIYDAANRLLKGKDPKLREQVDMLDHVSVKEFTELAGQTVSETEEETPLVELRDTEYGVDVVVDTTGSPVKVSNVASQYEENRLRVMDPQTGYEAGVKTEKAIEDTTINRSESGVATIEVEFVGGGVKSDDEPERAVVGGGSEREEVQKEDSEPNATVEPTDTTSTEDREPEEQTVREFLEENPGLRQMAEEKVGKTKLQMGLKMYGDKPLSEVPVEELLSMAGSGGSEDSEDSTFGLGGGGGDSSFSMDSIDGGDGDES